MELNQRIDGLESELKLLKNEVKGTLLDIREGILNYQSPFNSNPVAVVAREIVGVKSASEEEPIEASSGGAELADESSAKAEPVPVAPTNDHQPDNGPALVGSSPEMSAYESEEAPKPDPSAAQTNGHAQPKALVSPPLVKESSEVRLDLASIAGLARWAEDSTARVGKQHLKTLVEAYRLTGRLSNGIDEVLLKMASLVELDGPQPTSSMKDCIAVLVGLDRLLGGANDSQATLVSMLLNEGEDWSHR